MCSCVCAPLWVREAVPPLSPRRALSLPLPLLLTPSSHPLGKERKAGCLWEFFSIPLALQSLSFLGTKTPVEEVLGHPLL